MVKLTISAPLAILAYANSVHGVFSSTLFSGPDCLPSATCQLQIGPHTTNYDPPVAHCVSLKGAANCFSRTARVDCIDAVSLAINTNACVRYYEDANCQTVVAIKRPATNTGAACAETHDSRPIGSFMVTLAQATPAGCPA